MVEHSRRALIRGGLGLASLGISCAASPAFAAMKGSETDDEILPLWPGSPPGSDHVALSRTIDERLGGNAVHNRRLSKIGTPVLVVKRAPHPKGAAIMVIPGGGYSTVNYDAGGIEHAKWLNARGVTAFILVYRLPGEGWTRRADVPLQDAQRAMRLIRANAGRLGIDRNRVGVLGSSAGGHLAGSLATRFAETVYDPVDTHDALPALPDLAALLFPVVTMGENAHVPSRNALLGADPTEARRDAYSLEKHVAPRTPPTFVCCAGDDRVVPPVNSLALYRAMLNAGIKAELHVFQRGGHGFGAHLPPSVPTSHWPDLFIRFARYNGLFA